jgi:F-type H+-transporting ATPase subunit gamma
MARQTPVVKQVLPIPTAGKGNGGRWKKRPNTCRSTSRAVSGGVDGRLLPKSVDVQIFSALLETSTSEHAARMMAMDNATKACNDMIQNLTLVYNKARQAAITGELMDIVGGAEALKG